MINTLGGIHQLGMVVRDVDRTMDYMVKTLGIGPFYVVRDFAPQNFQYLGKPSEPVMTLGFAQSGPLQIELIEQTNSAPSAYQDFLADGREGSQHVALWFDDKAAYSGARERLLGGGLKLVHENGGNAEGRFAYFSTAMPGRLMLEIAEAKTPAVRHMFDLVASASLAWDGSDPIRTFF